jgi:hypothetical protein
MIIRRLVDAGSLAARRLGLIWGGWLRYCL